MSTTFDPEDFEHVREQQARDFRDGKARYTITVFDEGEQYVATQPEASLEAVGYSPAEAIANYARAVDAKNSDEQVVADE